MDYTKCNTFFGCWQEKVKMIRTCSLASAQVPGLVVQGPRAEEPLQTLVVPAVQEDRAIQANRLCLPYRPDHLCLK